jgi:hypothetical protein
MCPSIFLSIYLYQYLSVSQTQYHYVCVYLYLSVCLPSICLSVPVSVSVTQHHNVCPSIYLSVPVYVCPRVCMSPQYVCLSVPVFVCLYVSPSMSVCMFARLCQYLFYVHSMFALLSQTQALLQYYSLTHRHSK